MHADVDGATRDQSPVTRFTNIDGRCVHLIGIGGSGMSGAAALLHALGAKVSGSDLKPFDGLGSLVARGVRISIGHRASQLDHNVDVVVASAAVGESNPELSEARRRGVPVVKYAELLGALMGLREGVAIAGTHGKSTTSGMCVHLFREAGLAPSFVIGARSEQLGGGSGVGSGPHFIVEACEYDRSFLHMRPRLAAILNLERDHLDCYSDLDEIVTAFGDFAGHVDPRGVLVCNGDDSNAMRAARSAKAPVETFGFSEGVDWRGVNLRIEGGHWRFDIVHADKIFLSSGLSIPGKFNVLNGLAATALAFHAGAQPSVIATALNTYAGVDRRLTWRGEGRGVTILDDYAHHPTEIRATLEAVASCYESRRTWVVFQPHQYARTRHFMQQFAESFDGIEEVIVAEVYGARESDDSADTVGSEELVSRIRRHGGQARYVARLEAVADYLADQLKEGDLVLTMGAGDVWKVADDLVERFCGPDAVRRSVEPVDVVPAGGTSEVSVSTA